MSNPYYPFKVTKLQMHTTCKPINDLYSEVHISKCTSTYKYTSGCI